jgi:hypothetical protein
MKPGNRVICNSSYYILNNKPERTHVKVGIHVFSLENQLGNNIPGMICQNDNASGNIGLPDNR